MKLNRKWILVMSLVLSVVMATSGTLAYLTDRDTKTNTFTVGNVDIELQEPNYPGNTPTLLPGVEILKDPQIENIGSTEAWVWMNITVPTDLMSYIDWNTTDWSKSETISGTNTIVTMKRETLLPAGETTAKAFTKVALPASLTSMPASLGTGTIDIVVDAYAIQDANFANVSAAIAAHTNGPADDSDDSDDTGAGTTPATTVTVSNDEELAAAIAGNATKILMKSGNYKVVDVAGANRTLTIAAADGANVKLAGIDGQNSGTTTNLTVKGVTIDNSLQTEGWYIGTSQNIKPCVGVWGGDYTFENCKFYVTGESGAETGVMSWWTTDHNTMNFKNCSFNGGNNSARAMQIYGNYDLNVTNCTFNTAKDYSIKYVGAEGCKAVMNGNNVNATQNFVQLGSAPYAGKNYSITFTNNKLASGIKHYYVDNYENQSIIVDGVVTNAGTKTVNALLGGASSVTIDNTNGTVDVSTAVGVNNADITVNGGKVDAGTTGGFNKGLQHAGTVVYNDATITGSMSLYGDKVVFNRCTFDLTNISDYIWTYGAKEVEFNSCTFNTKGKAILVYNEGTVGSSTVTVKNCKFNASEKAYASAVPGQPCAAIEVDSSLIPGTYTIKVEGTNTVADNFSGIVRIKNDGGKNNVTVTGATPVVLPL